MQVYDDKQIIEALGEQSGGDFHQALMIMAMLSVWNADSDKRHTSISETLQEAQNLVSDDVTTVFFDCHAVYIGHVTVVVEEEADGKPFLWDIDCARSTHCKDSLASQHIVSFEARNGATLEIARRLRRHFSQAGASVVYVRTTRGVSIKRRWSVSPMTEDRQTSPLGDTVNIEEIFRRQEHERMLRLQILSLLTLSEITTLASAMTICNWTVNLEQYEIQATPPVLLVWGWLSKKAMERMIAKGEDQPSAFEWNCGRTPVLIRTIGEDHDVGNVIKRWREGLPPNAEPALKLVHASCAGNLRFDPV